MTRSSEPPAPRARRARPERAGTSLIEVMVVLAILSVAGAMFSQTMTVSRRLDPVGAETAMAAEGARTQLEKMHNHPFRDVFRLYNDDPSDDPGGKGTAPGSRFAVDGLSARLVRDDLLGATVVHVEAGPAGPKRILDEVLRRMVAVVGTAELLDALA